MKFFNCAREDRKDTTNFMENIMAFFVLNTKQLKKTNISCWHSKNFRLSRGKAAGA
jgi:hypothetical protein